MEEEEWKQKQITGNLGEWEGKKKGEKHWENLPSTRWSQANSGVNLSDGLEILHFIWFLIKQIFSLSTELKNYELTLI